MENVAIIDKDDKVKNKFKICQICGCRQYVNNFTRHRKSKRHQEVDYINNQCFEIVKAKQKDDSEQQGIVIIR